MVSTGLGVFPHWSPNSPRLFYLSSSLELMAVDIVESRAGFQYRAATRVFGSLSPANYDVAPKGDRFVFVGLPGVPGPPPPFTMVQNWLTRIER